MVVAAVLKRQIMIWTMGGTAGNGAGQTQVQNLVQINLAVNIEVREKKGCISKRLTGLS